MGVAEGQALLARAIAQYESGKLNRARADLEQAVIELRGSEDQTSLADSLTILGGFYHAAPFHDLGRGYYRAAVAIYTDLHDLTQAAAAIGNLGIVEQEAGRFREAEACYRRALELCEQSGDEALGAILSGQLGTLFHERGRLAEARESYDRVIPELRRAQDQHNCGLFLACRGAIAAAEDRRDDAAADFEEATFAVQILDDSSNAADAALWLLGGHLDLAEARHAKRTGNAIAAAELMVKAQTRIDSMEAELPESDDVRFSLRLLQKELLEAGATKSDSTDDLPGKALLISHHGRRVRAPDGQPVDLRRRIPLRRLVQRLVRERLSSPGRGLSEACLIEATWPERRGRSSSDSRRIKAAIATICDLGLASVLIYEDATHRISADVPVVLSARLPLAVPSVGGGSR